MTNTYMKNLFLLLMVIVVCGCSNEEKNNDPSYLPGREYKFDGMAIEPGYGGIDYFNELEDIENMLDYVDPLLYKLKDYYTINTEEKGELENGYCYKDIKKHLILLFSSNKCSIQDKSSITKRMSYIIGRYKCYKFKDAHIIERDFEYLINKEGIFSKSIQDSIYSICNPYFTGDYEFKYLADGKEVLRDEVEQLDSLESYTYIQQNDSIIIMRNSSRELKGVFKDKHKELVLKDVGSGKTIGSFRLNN